MRVNPTTGIFTRDKRGDTEAQRRSPAKTEAETGGKQPQAQGHLEPRRLEEAGRALPWSLWREHDPPLPGPQRLCPS